MDACAISLSGFSTLCSTDFFEHLSPADQSRHLDSAYKTLRPGGIYIIRTPHRANIRQQPASNHLDHVGLASYASLLRQAEDAGFQVRFGIAHFALVSPLNYHIPLEQWIEARVLRPFATYKALQKCGLANIVAHLRKPEQE
jgi:SAM-dependent methyltransferase